MVIIRKIFIYHLADTCFIAVTEGDPLRQLAEEGVGARYKQVAKDIIDRICIII